MDSWFNFHTIVMFLLGVALAGMVKMWLSRARSKVGV